jgi:hypothetical protein
MGPEVKCKVSDCTHWKTGEICTADRIQISVGAGSSREAFYNEFSGELSADSSKGASPGKSSGSEQIAEKMENTLCHTYAPKSKA